MKRDREEEMIHRGVQYSRAIRRFVKKTGRYPTRLEELENTNNIRFLRKRYKDPVTGKDFKLLHVGEVQLTSAAGIAGAAASGATPRAWPEQPAFGAAQRHDGSGRFWEPLRWEQPQPRPRQVTPEPAANPATNAAGDSRPNAGAGGDAVQAGLNPAGRGLAAVSYPARFLAEARSSAWPASAKSRRFASSITRITTTSGSSSTIPPWTAAD